MKIIARLLAFALAILCPGAALHAQAAGSVDPGFHPPNVTGGGGFVSATAVQPDGKIIVAGSFTTVDGIVRPSIARLEADGTVDASFDPGTGANSTVNGVVVQADGKIVIGGEFTAVNGQPRNRIARLNADGSVESTATFNVGTGADHIVIGLALQADGKILFGGYFSNVNGQPRTRIARLHTDGRVESTATFNPGAGMNEMVYSIAVQTDGKLVAAGLFTSVNGQPRNRIARLHADGSLEDTATFNPGTGPNRGVNCVAVQADGKILLGGHFTTVNGQPRNRIARLHADGSLESTATFNPGTGANEVVLSIVAQTDGKILLGGGFTTVNGQPRNFLARLKADGSVESDAAFKGDTGLNNSVDSVAVQADGKILVGGSFTTADGTSRGLARLTNDRATQVLTIPSASRVHWARGGAAPEVEQVTFELSTDGGTQWSPLGAGTRGTGGWELTGLSLPARGAVRARGRTRGGVDNDSSGLIEQIAAYTQPGSLDLGFDPNANGELLAAAVQPDGKIIIGGRFTTVGGTARNHIARLEADGALDASFDPGAGADSNVNCVAVQADGKIIIAGEFTSVAGVARNYLARLQADGALDTGFHLDTDAYVASLAVQADGKILVGGFFNSVGGVARQKIARLHADGTVDMGFDPGVQGYIYSIAVQADGKIILGGDFADVGGQERNYLARVDADGTVDPDFNPRTNSDVFTIAVQTDGKIIIGGQFTLVNGEASNYLARLHANGALDPDFNPDANDRVLSMALQADGQILVAGAFTSMEGEPRNRIARLHADGSVESTATFNAGTGADDTVSSVAVQADGKILLGGAFETIGGVARRHLARLENVPAPQTLGAPDVTLVHWLREGASPEAQSVTFELSTNNGGTWTLLGAGTLVADDWRLTGLSLPVSGLLRARARIPGGSSGLVEQVQKFTFDTTTQPAVLLQPATGTRTNSPVEVEFTLPEPALAGSVMLTFHDGITARTLTLSSSQESAGTHAFTFPVAHPTGSDAVASGPAIPDGIYTVTLSYQDELRNPPASVAATEVTIQALTVTTLRPTEVTPTSATLNMSVTGQGNVSAYFYYSLDGSDWSVTSTTIVGPINGTVEVSIPLLSLQPGKQYYFQAAVDHELGTSFGRVAIFSTLLAEAIHTATYATGHPVPNAGIPGGPPEDAIFTGFGVPAISENGSLAFLGKWTSPEGSGTGIFSNGIFVVKAGDPVPGIAGATFEVFKDPVETGNTTVALLATIAGPGVTRQNDTVVVADVLGSLAVLAREGEVAPGTGGARYESFTSVSARNEEVVWLAMLAPGTGTPRVHWTTNTGLWSAISTDVTELRLRDGMRVGQRTIAAFQAFPTVSGSPGQGRTHLGYDLLSVLALYHDGTRAVLAPASDQIDEQARTPYPVGPSLPGATVKSFGTPAAFRSSNDFAVAVTLSGVSAATSKAVLAGVVGAQTVAARSGTAAPGADGATFKSFSDPLYNGAQVAFAAKLAGPGVTDDNDDALFAGSIETPGLLAREGGQPPEVPEGAQWKKFTSLALPAHYDGPREHEPPPGETRGPLFVATLALGRGGVTTANDQGVWAVDSQGALRQLFREGDAIAGKTLKSFTFLQLVSGSPGVTRAFTANYQIAWRATFADGSTALMQTTIPTPAETP